MLNNLLMKRMGIQSASCDTLTGTGKDWFPFFFVAMAEKSPAIIEATSTISVIIAALKHGSQL